MVYAINALMIGWVASIWKKEGWQNILLALVFLIMALVNAALSSPFIYRLMGLS